MSSTSSPGTSPPPSPQSNNSQNLNQQHDDNLQKESEMMTESQFASDSDRGLGNKDSVPSADDAAAIGKEDNDISVDRNESDSPNGTTNDNNQSPDAEKEEKSLEEIQSDDLTAESSQESGGENSENSSPGINRDEDVNADNASQPSVNNDTKVSSSSDDDDEAENPASNVPESVGASEEATQEGFEVDDDDWGDDEAFEEPQTTSNNDTAPSDTDPKVTLTSEPSPTTDAASKDSPLMEDKSPDTPEASTTQNDCSSSLSSSEPLPMEGDDNQSHATHEGTDSKEMTSKESDSHPKNPATEDPHSTTPCEDDQSTSSPSASNLQQRNSAQISNDSIQEGFEVDDDDWGDDEAFEEPQATSNNGTIPSDTDPKVTLTSEPSPTTDAASEDSPLMEDKSPDTPQQPTEADISLDTTNQEAIDPETSNPMEAFSNDQDDDDWADADFAQADDMSDFEELPKQQPSLSSSSPNEEESKPVQSAIEPSKAPTSAVLNADFEADFDSDDDFEDASFKSGDDIDDFSDFEESEFEEGAGSELPEEPAPPATTVKSTFEQQPYSAIVNTILDESVSSETLEKEARAFFSSIIHVPASQDSAAEEVLHETNENTESEDEPRSALSDTISDVSLEKLYEKNFSQHAKKFSDIAAWNNSSIEDIFLKHIGFVKHEKKKRRHKRLHPTAAHTRTFSGLSTLDGSSVISGANLVTPATPSTASTTSRHMRRRSFSNNNSLLSPTGSVVGSSISGTPVPGHKNSAQMEEFSEHELEEFNNILEKSKNARKRPVSLISATRSKKSTASAYSIALSPASGVATPEPGRGVGSNIAPKKLDRGKDISANQGFDDDFGSDDDFTAGFAEEPKKESPSRVRSSSVTRGKTRHSTELSAINLDGLVVKERSSSSATSSSKSSLGETREGSLASNSNNNVANEKDISKEAGTSDSLQKKSTSKTANTNSSSKNQFEDDDEFDADFDDDQGFEEATFEEKPSTKQQQGEIRSPTFDDFDFLAGDSSASQQPSSENKQQAVQGLSSFDDFLDLTPSSTPSTATTVQPSDQNRVNDDSSHAASKIINNHSPQVSELLSMIPDLDFIQSNEFVKQSGSSSQDKKKVVSENMLDFF